MRNRFRVCSTDFANSCNRPRICSACGRSDDDGDLKTFKDIVERYICCCRPWANKEKQFYISLDVKDAIRQAALCQIDGKRHPHQRRFKGQTLKSGYNAIRHFNFSRDQDFSSIYDKIEQKLGGGWGFGALTIYDIAHRIGAKLGIAPKIIYLHRGTLDGARAIGVPGISAEKRQFVLIDKAFSKLAADEIEDCLCIFKTALRKIAGASNRIAPA